MNRLTKCLVVSTLLLSSCSWKPEKEVVTVEKVIAPTIAVVQKPKPIKMLDANIIVITEKNLPEVIKKVKAGMGEFVIYGLDPASFKNLALNFEQIKRYTDRPIKIRQKPRGRGTSGPSEATVPLSEDLKDAWCLVTSCSIAAVEAQCMGIPVICDEKSFAKEIGAQQLADIEDPYFVGCEDWLYSLAYQQFTPEEIENGKAVEILIDKGIL